jgi:pimeloyl-ACP methyl ester carboxylesterase
MNLEPEAFMNVPELLAYYGYPVEEHDVVTEDGYIIMVHRIPHGRHEKLEDRSQRIPVLLNSDIFLSSGQWLMNLPDQSIGYMLADAGYDVWLLNHRGNTYSRRHKFLDPDEREYWQFSYDEQGNYDLPAAIDYIIKETGVQKIHLMTYYMGAPPVNIFLSTRPEYNDKVRLVTGFTPAMSMNQTRVLMHTYISLVPPLLDIYQHYLLPELGPSMEVAKVAARFAGSYFSTIIKKQFLLQVAYTDGNLLNTTRFPTYFAHAPEGSSTYVIKQVVLWLATGYVRRLDWGPEVNLRKYGEETPSEYQLHRISAPYQMVMSFHDIMVTNEDVEYLASQVQNPILLNITEKHFSHVHLLLAPSANRVVYDPIIAQMKQIDEQYA